MPVIATPPGQHPGPWQLTIPEAGSVTLRYRVSDGKGGFFTRTAIASAIVPVVGYDYYANKFGLYRKTVNSLAAFLTVPSHPVVAGTVSDEWRFGIKLKTWEPYTAGTQGIACLCRGTTSNTEEVFIISNLGPISIKYVGGPVVTLTENHGIQLGQRVDFRLIVPSVVGQPIELYARINNGAEFLMGSALTPASSGFNPNRWLSGNQAFNGMLFYVERYRDGAPLYQFTFNDFWSTTFLSRHDPQVTAVLTKASGHIEPQVDLAEWSPATPADDLVAVSRPTIASLTVDRRLALTGISGRPAGVTRRYLSWVRTHDLTYDLGLCSIGTTETVRFNADGSISARVTGMGSTVVLRPAGAHVLNGTKQLIELAVSDDRFQIKVDDVLVAEHVAPGLSFIPDKYLEGASGTTVWRGRLYNLAVYDDDTLIEYWPLDAGEGTGVMVNTVGTAVATLGSANSWVHG